jgi:hypothetical protein
MNERLTGILVESGIEVIAGLFLAYMGFLSPIFRRSSEQLAPDRWLGTVRVSLRILGPLLCLIAGLRALGGIHQENVVQVWQWHEFTSPEGRFRVSSPGEFQKIGESPYGEPQVKESSFAATLPTLGFLVTYVDLPSSMLKAEPNEILNEELDRHVRGTGVKLLSKEATPIAGYPAIRFKLRNVQGGFFAEGVLLLAKQRRYQLAVRYTSESSSQDHEKFFESFQVLKSP